MRVSKDPEVRKQEMIETAMKLFEQKGYEATTISDIAREMNVVPGLFYKYFPSKEALYRCASEQYADRFAMPIIEALSRDFSSIEEVTQLLTTMLKNHGENQIYHSFYHTPGNELFHQQLNSIISEKISEPIADFLIRLAKLTGNEIPYPSAMARFFSYGIGVLLDDDQLSENEKLELSMSIIQKLLT